MPTTELAVPGLHNALKPWPLSRSAVRSNCRKRQCAGGAAPLQGIAASHADSGRARGVAFFDDSKAQRRRTVAALTGLGRKCILIAGGDGKGQDFRRLPNRCGQARAGGS